LYKVKGQRENELTKTVGLDDMRGETLLMEIYYY